MLSSPEFWVGVSFVIFLGVLGYFRVHTRVLTSLDDRADRIRKELEEAQRLREEAQAMLAEAQRKQREAEKEADDILAQAKEEAKLMAAESKKTIEEMIERRREMAEFKIAQAEEQAIKDVRAAATDLAISAAGEVIAQQVKGDKAQKLIDDSIGVLKKRLN